MPDTVALVPARSGSKGVPGKNIRLLGGHPLVAWTVAVCRQAELIDRVIVSTDSHDYADVARRYGAEVPFLRPAALAGDDSPDIDFIEHALDWLVTEGTEPTHVVHMRPTTPFRNPRLVDDAIRSFLASADATALRSVHEMSQSAYKSLELTLNGWLRPLDAVDTAMDEANLGRQFFPTTFMANGYVDVLSVEFIRATGLLHGDRVLPFRTQPVLEVDTEDDMEHLAYRLTKDPGLLTTIFA